MGEPKSRPVSNVEPTKKARNPSIWLRLSQLKVFLPWHEPSIRFTDIVAKAAVQGFDVMGIMHTAGDLIAGTLPVIRGAHAGPVMAYSDAGYFEMPH